MVHLYASGWSSRPVIMYLCFHIFQLQLPSTSSGLGAGTCGQQNGGASGTVAPLVSKEFKRNA